MGGKQKQGGKVEGEEGREEGENRRSEGTISHSSPFCEEMRDRLNSAASQFANSASEDPSPCADRTTFKT